MSAGAILLVALFALPMASNAQNSRDYIKEKIREKGECKSVAITKTGGDLMLYGRNGYWGKYCPSDLMNALSDYNAKNKLIDDVILTEGGRWLIIVGDNGFRWNDIPSDLESTLRRWNEEEEVVTAVSFNDHGVWVAVSTNYIRASNKRIQDWLAEGCEDYGKLWTVCVTDEGAIVAVYEKGYQFDGSIPSSLKDALKETNIDVYRLKIAGSSWFFANKSGRYRYHM